MGRQKHGTPGLSSIGILLAGSEPLSDGAQDVMESSFISMYPGQVQREDEDFFVLLYVLYCHPLLLLLSSHLGKPAFLSCDRHQCGVMQQSLDLPGRKLSSSGPAL